MATELSDSSKVVYGAIIRHFREHGYAPSIQELCDATGFTSKSSVFKHLNKLEAAGKIQRAGPQHRIKLGSAP